MKRAFVGIGGLLLLSLAQPLTAGNWAQHPQIVEVRRVYQKAQTLKQQNKLKKQQIKYEGCAALDLERTLWLEGQSPRLYLQSGGSDDSAVSLEHTYDAKGRLRFVLVKAGAVNNTQIEYRYYIDAAGKVIWTDKRSSGPGYPFPNFAVAFVFKPQQSLKAKNPCD